MRFPWFRHFQTFLVGLLLLTLIATGTLLWKANQKGFSGQWGQHLQEQLEAHGFHAEFSSMRLSLSKGLVAKDLKIYASQDHSKLVASVDNLILDVDRSSAIRGEWNIRSAEFENAFLLLPDNFAPHHLTELSGKATFSRENQLHLYDTKGRLGQLNISLDAQLSEVIFPFASEEKPKDAPLNELVALHNEISKWTTPKAEHPQLTLKINGNLSHPSTLESHFLFEAPHLSRLDYQINDLALTGRLTQSSLLFEKLTFHDGDGPFEGEGLYDFVTQTAQFEAQSQASLERILRQGLDIHKLDNLIFTDSPLITTKGKVTRTPEGKAELSLTGHLSVANFQFLGSSWSSLSSDYSWQKGNLYLRDLVLTHPEGTLNGKLLFQDENIRYQAVSTLPAHLFDPFVKPEGNIRKILDTAKFTADTKILLELNGSIRPNKLTDWSASGKVKIENFQYNQVPANFGSATFNLTPLQAVYSNPEIEFDLTNDPSYHAFGGPSNAIARADEISYDHAEKTTRIEHLHGICWPAPILRLFLPNTANYLERTYRASQPPSFSSSGIIDHLPPHKNTAFHTRIETSAPIYYDFLGKPIELRNTSLLIHSRPRQIDVKKLSSYAFSGPIDGELTILLPNKPGLSPDFRGNLRWSRLRLADIASAYEFDKIEKGLVTGRLDFSGAAGKIQTLDGAGNIGLEQGELFKAPVFGPLSPLIAGIQGHQRGSHETARDASAQFLIKEGILHTDDFIASTDSLTVKAEGSIDLARKTLDMTARADTEGLLKLVTLPLNLTGLNGLFQFHGTGPVSYTHLTLPTTPYV